MNPMINRKGIQNGNSSRSIMYQSRMKILKSRDGSSTRRAKLGERIMCENSFSSFFVDRGTRKPCPEEKLLPPLQLMTRERSFRHLYLKYHPPKVHVRMDFLQKREDPKFKKKREDIFARIRAAEIASERLKREKERITEHRRSALKMNDGLSISNSLSEHSVNDESQLDALSTHENTHGQKEGVHFTEDSNVVVSGFVTDPSKKMDSADVTVASVNSGGDDDDDDGNLAFLSDWKKEKHLHVPLVR